MWCSLDPGITTCSSYFFKCVATQLRMEKNPKRAPAWTWPHHFSLSPGNSVLHVSSRWILTAFAGLSKKQQGILFLSVFRSTVVIVAHQLGPTHGNFHLKSSADLFRAVQMNHCLPVWVGEKLTVPESSKVDDRTWRVSSLRGLW